MVLTPGSALLDHRNSRLNQRTSTSPEPGEVFYWSNFEVHRHMLSGPASVRGHYGGISVLAKGRERGVEIATVSPDCADTSSTNRLLRSARLRQSQYLRSSQSNLALLGDNNKFGISLELLDSYLLLRSPLPKRVSMHFLIDN